MLRSGTPSVVRVVAHLSKVDRQHVTVNVATIPSHVFKGANSWKLHISLEEEHIPQRASQLRGTIGLRRSKWLRSLGQRRVRRVTSLVLLRD
jgi:hypothetical protein